MAKHFAQVLIIDSQDKFGGSGDKGDGAGSGGGIFYRVDKYH